jgi:transcription initiation factor TFIIIB Brf1 subunit/transcription initiation factor TFIIB
LTEKLLGVMVKHTKEPNMTMNALTREDEAKLKTVFDEVLKFMTQIDLMKESAKDLVKSVCEELDLDKKVINKAIRMAYKNTLSDEQRTFDAINEVLQKTGRA